jgi:hypothetical protein
MNGEDELGVVYNCVRLRNVTRFRYFIFIYSIFSSLSTLRDSCGNLRILVIQRVTKVIALYHSATNIHNYRIIIF